MMLPKGFPDNTPLDPKLAWTKKGKARRIKMCVELMKQELELMQMCFNAVKTKDKKQKYHLPK